MFPPPTNHHRLARGRSHLQGAIGRELSMSLPAATSSESFLPPPPQDEVEASTPAAAPLTRAFSRPTTVTVGGQLLLPSLDASPAAVDRRRRQPMRQQKRQQQRQQQRQLPGAVKSDTEPPMMYVHGAGGGGGGQGIYRMRSGRERLKQLSQREFNGGVGRLNIDFLLTCP